MLKNYFVVAETQPEKIATSFLITDAIDSSCAWDEAVNYLEVEFPHTPITITKFERVE